MEINEFGESKLHLAIRDSNLAEVKKLIQEGINTEIPNHEGDTAIFYALHKNIEILKYLFEVGKCNLLHKNAFGTTPIRYIEIWIENNRSSYDKTKQTDEQRKYYINLLIYLKNNLNKIKNY